MANKKVLFVITKGNFGGAQRYVFDLASNLMADFDVAVAYGQGKTLPEKLAEKNIRTIELNNLKRDIDISSDFSVLKEMFFLLKKEAPDIIHLNSSKVGFLGALASRIYNLTFGKDKKVKIIFTAHGWASNEDGHIFKKIFYYILHTITVALTDTTIAVSEKTKRDMSAIESVAKKIKVIHNGIFPIPLLSKANARRELDKDSKFKIWIGTISELHKNKGLDIAIKGISGLLRDRKDVGFYIIGDGEEKESLQKLVKELGAEEQIKFLGFISDARKYQKAFDIFTLTSRTEAFPYTLIEAGFSRTPVIATDVGGIPEIIKNLETGLLIKPKIPSEFFHAVRYALEHKKDLTKFGEALYELSTKEFSMEKMIEETKKIYY